MSDHIYDVPAEWAKSAYVDDAKYQAMYAQSIADPDALLGRTWQTHRLVQTFHEGEKRLVWTGRGFDQVVRGRRHQRRA